MNKPQDMEVPTKRNPDALFIWRLIEDEVGKVAQTLKPEELDLVSPLVRSMYDIVNKERRNAEVYKAPAMEPRTDISTSSQDA